jgi:N-methylhydantoinase A
VGSSHGFRIGIDVGGTFTDAVAVDAASFELLGQIKVPTTHRASAGVAQGIIDALQGLLRNLSIDPAHVSFISHGTTQATNALLEGDVARVGIVGIGKGLEGLRARRQTRLAPIELAPGAFLRPLHRFLAVTVPRPEQARQAVDELAREGAEVIVASGLYAVDDPSAENIVVQAARERGLPATGAHEITKLYGLRTRTRTAVINASILPKMLEVADSVERSVADAGISAPLMIMRGDGGVMNVDQLRKRPILTLVSGPAAGVAGALMYEKVSDAIFLEVGGTSVDISAIRDGRVQSRYAEIGGHRTYLQSLDVRSVGIGGGSMLRLRRGTIDIGPRSAHIAGLDYAVYQQAASCEGTRLVRLRPLACDPEDYVAVETAAGRFALTLSCAANLAGFVGDTDWAHGNRAAAERAFAPLAQQLGRSVIEVARDAVDAAVLKTRPTVEALMADYGIDRRNLVLVGGGGGAATLVPALARALDCEFRIARNAPIISPLGVALALVRDVVERMIPNPTADDLRRVRAEAENAAVAAGASRNTVEVDVVVDAQRNVVRAIASGATELRYRARNRTEIGEEERRRAAAQSLAAAPETLELAARTPEFSVYKTAMRSAGPFGRFSKAKDAVRVVDREGVVRLRLSDARLFQARSADVPGELRGVLEHLTTYGDAGKMLPSVHLLIKDKIVSLAGLPDPDLIVSTAADHVRSADPGEPSVIVAEIRA